jgi:hypothetical protein
LSPHSQTGGPWAKLLDCAGLLALSYPALYYSRAGSKLSATSNLPILKRKTEFTMAVVPNTMDNGSPRAPDHALLAANLVIVSNTNNLSGLRRELCCFFSRVSFPGQDSGR